MSIKSSAWYSQHHNLNPILIFISTLTVTLFLDSGRYYTDDFNHYFATWHLALHGKSPYCTDLRALGLADVSFHPDVIEATNPPTLALAFSPLALLPLRQAWLVWIGMNQLALVLSVRLLLRLARIPITLRREAIAALLLSVSYPGFDSLFYSQVQPTIFFLVLVGIEQYRKRREFIAGAVWMVAIALKVVPALILFWLIGRRSKSALIGASVAGILTLCLGFVIPNLYLDYLSCAPKILNKWVLGSLWNISFVGMTSRVAQIVTGFSGGGSLRLDIPILFVSAVGSMYLGLKSRRLGASRILSSIAIVFTVSFFSFSVAWPSYLIICYLPIAVLSRYRSLIPKQMLVAFASIAFLLFAKQPFEARLSSVHLWFLKSLSLSFFVLFLCLNMAVFFRRGYGKCGHQQQTRCARRMWWGRDGFRSSSD